MSDVEEQTPSAKRREPLNRTVRVVLVDDHDIWRGGVRSMLEDTEFSVVGEASSGKRAVDVVREARPDLVLLDIRMAGGDGLDALQEIKREHPRTAVVMLTTYDNPTYMARAVAGGAAGYLLKGIHLDELLEALRAVADGELLLSAQELVRSLRGISDAAKGAPELIEPLTEREAEVLRLVATGLNNRDIASVLFVAESTIKTHVEHILGKLGVSDRVQAAVWAARNGMTSSESGHHR
ncbi:MAG TPA: response regulator transcription factor [Armatimonadaceae bacterium]|nr:response regulator transcription factor [Armatimonadaceae bacterium]